MKNRVFAAIGAAVLLAGTVPAGAQQSGAAQTDVQKELAAIRAQQDAILKELQAIRQAMASRPSPAPTPPAQPTSVSIANAASRGEASAKLVLVEFSDYQCPFCGRHVRETWPQLESIHKFAFKSAEAAECAGDQNTFWPMHDLLFANQTKLDDLSLSEYARTVGLDGVTFQQCLDSHKYTDRIRADLAAGSAAGVTGTPGFLLGVVDPTGQNVQVLSTIKGAMAYVAFKDRIDILLAQVTK